MNIIFPKLLFLQQSRYCILLDDGFKTRRLYISKENFSIKGMVNTKESLSSEFKSMMESSAKDFGFDLNMPEDCDVKSSGQIVYHNTKFDEPINSEIFQLTKQ